MARSTKDARDSAAQEEIVETSVELSLSDLLAQALIDIPRGPAHGALLAIETTLIELKHRAASVGGALGDEYIPMLNRIGSL